MEKFCNFISENYEWIFGGIGAVVIGLILESFLRKNANSSVVQKQKAGDKSTNIQIGRDNKERK